MVGGPYRRKMGDREEQLPLKDIAEAGGWKDVETLVTCYQASDEERCFACGERRAQAARGVGGAVVGETDLQTGRVGLDDKTPH